MRQAITLIAAVFLILALGVFAGAPQGSPENNPQYRPGDPQYRRDEPMRGDRRSFIGQLSADLARQAEYLAQGSYDYFMGWNGVITDREQSILFRCEEFSAACRLFNRLTGDRSDFFRRESLRSNLYNASRYIAASFRALEQEIKLSGLDGNYYRMRRDGRPFQWDRDRDRPQFGPFGLMECRRLVDRIVQEFSGWKY